MISTIFTTATNVNIGLYVSSRRLIANCLLHLLPATKITLHLSASVRRYKFSMNGPHPGVLASMFSFWIVHPIFRIWNLIS